MTGIFGRQTARAVRLFKEAHGLPANGIVDTDTWNALLAFTPYRPRWTAAGASTVPGPRQAGDPPALGEPAGQGLRDPARPGSR